MVGPGSGRTVMARAYLAPAPVNDNIRNMSTCDIFKITCDLHHVCAERPSGELASFDNRQNLRPFQRTSTVSKSALAISEEQHDLADAVFGQLDRLNSRAAARANLEKGATHPSEIWSAGKDLGWNGLAIAEEHGGSGFGLAELAVVLEAQGRELSPGPFLPTVAAAVVIDRCAPDSVRAQLLPGLADGSTVGALALSGSVTIGSDLVVTGESPAVLGAPDADVLVIAAGEDVVVVDAAADGVTVTALDSLDTTRSVGSVALRGATVDEARVPRRAARKAGA